MARVDGRLCNVCGERITMKESEWAAHGDKHPDHFLQGFETKWPKPRFGEKNFFNPETGNWHTDRKYLSRELKSIGWTNEKFYLKYGKEFMPETWDENNNDPQTGNLAGIPTCGCCGGPTKFNQWDYDKFCSYGCSTKWYADNSNRIDEAMKTLRERKAVDPDHHLRPNQKRYWIVRGYSDEEARGKVRERNAVNSLENYVKRAGGDVEAGTAAHAARQEKWLASLKASGMYGGYSKVGVEFFDKVAQYVDCLRYGVNEVALKIAGRTINVDCIRTGHKKVVEFFGDYWHANPSKYPKDTTITVKGKTAQEIWDIDKKRIDALKTNGYDVLVIWEGDYYRDPDSQVLSCVEFFLGDLRDLPDTSNEPVSPIDGTLIN